MKIDDHVHVSARFWLAVHALSLQSQQSANFVASGVRFGMARQMPKD